jgi:hypothetical protein
LAVSVGIAVAIHNPPCDCRGLPVGGVPDRPGTQSNRRATKRDPGPAAPSLSDRQTPAPPTNKEISKEKLWLLLAIAAPLQLIHSQEVKHASSVEQCRAEAAVWAKADNIVPPLTELFARLHEMSQCIDVNPAEQSRDLIGKYLKQAIESTWK